MVAPDGSARPVSLRRHQSSVVKGLQEEGTSGSTGVPLPQPPERLSVQPNAAFDIRSTVCVSRSISQRPAGPGGQSVR